jgi:hypothetical protein
MSKDEEIEESLLFSSIITGPKVDIIQEKSMDQKRAKE